MQNRAWNADRHTVRCDACDDLFEHYAAHIMVPNRSAIPGIYGIFCSWNCAKRVLLRMRNRPWFALMAITALRTGCRLPIDIKLGAQKEIVRYIPSNLQNVQPRNYVHTPMPPLLEENGDAEDEPQVYDVY